MDNQNDPVPRWVIGGAILMILGTIAAGAIFWKLEQIETNEQIANCEAEVRQQEKHRAMWLALAERFPDSEEIDFILKDLEVLLPPLYCDGILAKPVKEGTEGTNG